VSSIDQLVYGAYSADQAAAAGGDSGM